MPRAVVVWVALLVWATNTWAEDAEPPCANGAHRDFDFWAGEWRVDDIDGNHVGNNTITIEEAGCVLVEHWRSVGGISGQSLNFYDPLDAKWRQVWVNPGSIIELSGGRVGGYMVLEGTITYLRTGERFPLRGTWAPLPDGRVRQLFEESRAAGTWSEWFEGFYTRMTSLDKVE